MRQALNTFSLYRRAGLSLSLALRRAAADLPGLSRIAALRRPRHVPELL